VTADIFYGQPLIVVLVAFSNIYPLSFEKLHVVSNLSSVPALPLQHSNIALFCMPNFRQVLATTTERLLGSFKIIFPLAA